MPKVRRPFPIKGKALCFLAFTPIRYIHRVADVILALFLFFFSPSFLPPPPPPPPPPPLLCCRCTELNCTDYGLPTLIGLLCFVPANDATKEILQMLHTIVMFTTIATTTTVTTNNWARNTLADKNACQVTYMC